MQKGRPAFADRPLLFGPCTASLLDQKIIQLPTALLQVYDDPRRMNASSRPGLTGLRVAVLRCKLLSLVRRSLGPGSRLGLCRRCCRPGTCGNGRSILTTERRELPLQSRNTPCLCLHRLAEIIQNRPLDLKGQTRKPVFHLPAINTARALGHASCPLKPSDSSAIYDKTFNHSRNFADNLRGHVRSTSANTVDRRPRRL